MTQDIFTKLMPDRGIAEPVYQQLMKRIVALIAAGEISGQDSLPSERLLAEKLSLSRTTVRRCYTELRAQNLLSSQGRAGFTVNDVPNLQPKLGRLKGFTEEMKELGLTPSTRILERTVVTDRTIASVVGRPSHAQFLRLVRVRCGDDVPLSREVAWYDLTSAPQIADWDVTGSIYDYLKTVCNVRLGRAEQTIEAVMSSAEESAVFGFEQSSPCLLFKRKTYTASGQIVEYVEGTFRGDAYTYHIDLGVS
ncbi:MAG: GntR family transcriptional regulator [Sulfuriferula sp.]|nr:GntR family transcriptional regulator [Sulfuriferula sp.]